MKPLRIAWRLLLILAHVLVAIIAALFGAKITVHGKKQVHPELIRWWALRLCRIFQLRITTTGSPPAQTSLVVANHISWLDIIVLGASMHTSFLSKAEIGSWPLVGWLSRATGTIFIHRGRGQFQEVSDAIAHRLKGDQVLTLFPEGKTTDGSSVSPFFPRLFGAAIEAGIPVLPVAIRYEVDGKRDRLTPYIDDQHILHNAFRLLGRKSSDVHVHFGAPIPSANMERRQLAAAARQHILDTLDSY